MKKVFIAISAVLMASVLAVLITLNVKKKNVAVAFDTPSVIRVYNKSSSPVKSAGYSKEDKEFNEIIECIDEMTNISFFDRLLDLKTIDTKIEVSNDGTYISYSSDLKQGNIVIELDFSEEQDLVVYENGHTRVISYWCISYVISPEEGATDIVVYYSNTNSSQNRDESYAKNNPIILKGYVSEIIEYVDSLSA